jgi:uncharacterized protein
MAFCWGYGRTACDSLADTNNSISPLAVDHCQGIGFETLPFRRGDNDKGVTMKSIYINLVVRDLDKSKAFFSALGYEFNPQYTNEQAACLVIEQNIFVMLLTQEHFNHFIDKPLGSAHESTQVLLCQSCESREQVDQLVAKAVQAGGKVPRPPQEMGFMYGHVFEDLDGYVWELIYITGQGEATR